MCNHGNIAVAAEDIRDQPRAAGLAATLGLPTASPVAETHPLLLVVTPHRVELRQTGSGAPGPVYTDFVSGRNAYRRRYGGGRRELLARAVGVRHGRSPTVIDATAGLGRDAFVLAALGCSVTLLERSPIIAALLDDAIDRARKAPELQQTMQRMELKCVDAIDYLKREIMSEQADVIYLDPMYPHRLKSALVKKEMRLLRLLVGDDPDSSRLLDLARERAKFRVVVKRPAGAEYLGGELPNAEIKGPNTRYDLYINSGFHRGAPASRRQKDGQITNQSRKSRRDAGAPL